MFTKTTATRTKLNIDTKMFITTVPTAMEEDRSAEVRRFVSFVDTFFVSVE